MRLYRCKQLRVTILLSSMFSCTPFVKNYQHPCFLEKNGLIIVSRSKNSYDSQGKNLNNPIIDLPIECTVNRKAYKLYIYTPINTQPVVFINCYDINNKKIIIRGSHIVNAKYQFHYSFMLSEAKGEPVKIEVLDQYGVIIGNEELTYIVKNRGFKIGIDSI